MFMNTTTDTSQSLAVKTLSDAAEITTPNQLSQQSTPKPPGPMEFPAASTPMVELPGQTYPQEKLSRRRAGYLVAVVAFIAVLASIAMVKLALDAAPLNDGFRWFIAAAMVLGAVSGIHVFLDRFYGQNADPVVASIAACAVLILLGASLLFARVRAEMLIDHSATQSGAVEWSPDTQDEAPSKPNDASLLLLYVLSWAVPLASLGLELAEGVTLHWVLGALFDPELLAFDEMQWLRAGKPTWKKETLFAWVFPLLIILLVLFAMAKRASAATTGAVPTVTLADFSSSQQAIQDHARFCAQILSQAPAGARQVILEIGDNAFAQRHPLLDATIRSDSSQWLTEQGRKQLQGRFLETAAKLKARETTGMDILGEIELAKDLLKISNARPAKIVEVGNPVDRKVDFRQDPAAVRSQLNKLASSGALPDLHGTRLYLLGVEPTGQNEYRALLSGWLEYCRLTGASLMAFSIDLRLADISSSAPVSLPEGSGPATPVSASVPPTSYRPTKPPAAHPTVPRAPLRVTLQQPSPDAMVDMRSLVSGTVSDPNAQVWPVVCVDGDRCWVQKRASVKKDGSWEAFAVFGRGPVDKGVGFTIVAVVPMPTDKLSEAQVLDAPPLGAQSDPIHVTRR